MYQIVEKLDINGNIPTTTNTINDIPTNTINDILTNTINDILTTTTDDIILSTEQEMAINKFKKGENIFLTGQGGTGKSFLINEFIKIIKNISPHKIIKVTALTGTAAILLKCKATTIHSWSGIKLARGTIEEVIEYTYRNNSAKKNWNSTDILIVDEVSMMSQKIFEILVKLSTIIRKSTYLFGGIQVIFCGDFFQLAPVPNYNDELTEKFCFQSPLWETIFKKENHIELKTVFRQKDIVYKSILSDIRIGNINEESFNILNNRLYLKPPPDIQITKLFPTLKLVEIENQKQFNLIDSDIFEYEFYTNINNKIYIDTGTEVPSNIIIECKNIFKQNPNIIEYEIKYLLTNSKCTEKIQLKVGAFVMTTVNLNLEKGICNGSQGIIIEINEINEIPIPKVKFYNNVIMDISYYSWQSENYPVISIDQIPLILAWAISIHKSQGLTLKYAEINIGDSIFAEGQIYVALSRVESLDGLYLTAFNPDKIKVNNNVLEFYNNLSLM
jgi:ATP-dependent DNA helicase PIF1